MARIRAEGFEAILECALIQPSTGIAHLISMLGPREAVRAIWAKGIGGYGDVRLEGDGRVQRVRASDVVMRQTKLPSGATHLLVASKALLEGDVLIARTPELDHYRPRADRWLVGCSENLQESRSIAIRVTKSGRVSVEYGFILHCCSGILSAY